MNKILIISFVLLLTFSLTSTIHAVDSVHEPSAMISHGGDTDVSREALLKKRVISRVLSKYNSTLTDQAEVFVDAAIKYDIDPYLVVSISGLESFFGRFMVPGNYNAWGWGGGYIGLESWENAITTISKALHERYYGRGAETLADVGRIYAESPTWAVRVQFFIDQFYKEESRLQKLDELL
ncbi:hypothetical protein A3D80_04745 [Candidatus Roizmanbacteria bacterium RIFCSPHIGHO2_02_FULL_40_13b]|uniref:Mannosyl-glycoprotein endo-beta-N-acetylglucosamidase-like domain-containing protein n=1 Tax=Candidatus Roizmanbacteria bacterium RIFCSPHIGHO2_01_FULL_39_24 TaxID=1802032 RepID=A0A1F7GLF2_9BACT|nr:MAG: hypothetical protein A2799_04600 [Candidatus Roizmanbacteria bacterium RIFCSPHIGHO2_01_FULL_39_24]OGK28031.1 MAG: hypothetical protein A3D80_04745 [Candidatus Roizmanbacteria bacterium RIFCSPHIGHO2_02_FULL_40_13b]OGK50296.1 MAG: hypothetical protein A3A56_04395 [Candidatus Roizmanbacteria bacterium RIFCSPLOWO2_01_FULL_40_32]OGK56170.1 MAG: hypothetical protein A3H83_00235 [Candidatus Roizmanbacteria bacterium RIFCSPLOWO2_02_FULL_39_8]